jgi:hypothetical protein
MAAVFASRPVKSQILEPFARGRGGAEPAHPADAGPEAKSGVMG